MVNSISHYTNNEGYAYLLRNIALSERSFLCTTLSSLGGRFAFVGV